MNTTIVQCKTETQHNDAELYGSACRNQPQFNFLIYLGFTMEHFYITSFSSLFYNFLFKCLLLTSTYINKFSMSIIQF